MKFDISADRKTLTITADLQERADMDQEEPTEWEALETLVANSELQWVNPADTGDLTDAPMLGILGEEQRDNSGPFGAVLAGNDGKGAIYCPILERWAFMAYETRSFVSDLSEHGRAVFTS